MGVNIDRADMAHWTILCAERYLSILYDYLHERLYDYHVIQADETPVRVTKEDRSEGDRHYMWVYRTGKNVCGQADRPVRVPAVTLSRPSDGIPEKFQRCLCHRRISGLSHNRKRA